MKHLTKVFSLLLYSYFGMFSSAIAAPQVISLKFPTDQYRGAPTATSGGATRSDEAPYCANTSQGDFNVLSPNNSRVLKTISANPTIFFYIPPTQATLGEVILLDKDDKELYTTQFLLPKQSSGIASVVLHPQQTLISGESYKYSLAIICDSQFRNRDIVVSGELKYTTIDEKVAQSLKNQDYLKKANYYAKQGYWLDTLENTAKISSRQPEQWKELLESAGLKDMSSFSLIDCCTPIKIP